MLHSPYSLAAMLAMLAMLAGAPVISSVPARANAQASPAPSSSVAALARAPGAEVTTVTPEPGWFTEPSIAVNPKDPEQVVGAYQDNAHVAYSRDGGETWRIADGTAPPTYRVSGDVSITFDNTGHAILCYIAFDRLGTTDYWAHNATRNGIYVRRSLDGGKTWEATDVAVKAFPTSHPGIQFEDKPYVVADNNPHSPYAGNLYIGWTEFQLDQSIILFSRSTDDGRTWSAPIRISTHAGLPRDDNGNVEGFTGVVGPDGTVYAAWADGNTIAFTASHDGGKTFAPSHSVIEIAPPYFKVADVARANGFPQIAIDPRGGGRGGRLYVTWSDYRNGDVDVFASTSADHGRSWTKAVRVNTDAVHNGADQFFQWLAVDPTTGAANVMFYDRRGDPANRKAIVVLARSTDGGRSFANYAWTGVAFDPENAFLGDYTGLAALGGRVYGIWTEQAPLPPAPSDSAVARRARARVRPHSIVRIGVAEFAAGAKAPVGQ